MLQSPHVVAQLRHCATSHKVAGSNPDGVYGIFHLHNPSGRTVALGSTEPPGIFPGGVKATGVYGRQPYHLNVPITSTFLEPTSWNPLGMYRD